MTSVTPDAPAGRAMPLLDHLVELRNRLFWVVGTLAVAFGGCYFVAEEIYTFLMAPLTEALADDPGRRMIYTSLTEVFFSYMKVAFWAGAFLTFPVLASQLWKFVAPGLYRTERHVFLPYLVATPVLFFLGGLMAYYVIFPLAWMFFLGFETAAAEGAMAIELEARVGEYLNLVMALIFAFGIAFQLPVALTLLARAGLASAAGLKRSRRFAIVGIFVAAAVLTPPDVISQVGLAIPLLALYEASILAVRVIERHRAERQAAEEAVA